MRAPGLDEMVVEDWRKRAIGFCMVSIKKMPCFGGILVALWVEIGKNGVSVSFGYLITGYGGSSRK